MMYVSTFKMHGHDIIFDHPVQMIIRSATWLLEAAAYDLGAHAGAWY